LKFAKYAVIVLLILAIIGTVIHLQREAIVRNLANAALSEQGIIATDLSIDTLGADRVLLSRIVLEQEDGTRYVISGLSFPVKISAARPESVSIDQLEIISTARSGAPPPFSRWLRMVLQLPDDVPDMTVTIARLAMSGMPVIENVRWYSAAPKQQLQFNVQAIEVSIEVARIDPDHHEVAIAAAIADDPESMSVGLTVRRADYGFSISGVTRLDLAPWIPVLQSMGWVSPETSSVSASLASEIQFDLFDDEARPTPFNASISLNGEMKAEYNVSDDFRAAVQANLAAPLNFSIEYPSLAWTVTTEQVVVNTEIEPVGNVSVYLGNLRCATGIVCTVHGTVNASSVDIGTTRIGSAIWTASTTIVLGETTKVELAPGFEIMLGDIAGTGFSVDSIRTNANLPLQIYIDDNGWRSNIDQLNLAVENLASNDDLSTSFLLSFGQLQVRDSGVAIQTDLSISPETASLSLQAYDIVVPDISGHLSWQNDLLTSQLSLSKTTDSISINMKATHNFLTDHGSLNIENATLDLSQAALSAHVLDWPFKWDLSSGKMSASLQLGWGPNNSEIEYDGMFQTRVVAVAGNYEDIVFFGLNNDLDGSLDSSTGMTLSQSIATLELLEIGLPVRDIEVDFQINMEEPAIHLNTVSMSAFGGLLLADPFVYRFADEINAFVLRPQSIQLRFMTELAEFENIELTGSISGVLPMTISEKSLTIENGRLDSDPPGGVIRYLPGMIGNDAGVPASDLDVVTRALGNFQFNALSSDVDYTDSGDLKLQMRLTGINPDMDKLQPVILNLSIENNIPQLLRSLQATRSIQEILEKKSAKPTPVLPQL
jgi:hypothetical protein